MTLMQRWFLRLPDWLIVIVLLLVLVIGLWTPFGLNVIGIQEEWRNLAHVESGQIITAELRARPTLLLPVYVAHFLTPDSFVGYNLVQMTLFVGKGFVSYLILKRLHPGKAAWAMLTAVLFVIFPADEGLMTLRATPIHMALFCLLLAVYFLLMFWDTRKLPALFGMWISLAISLLTYELAYPLVVAVPLVLVWKERRISKRVIYYSLLWYAVPVITLLYTLYNFLFLPESMSSRLLEQGTNAESGGLISEMLKAAGLAYQRHFVTGWMRGIQMLTTNAFYLMIAIITAGSSLCAGLLLSNRNRDEGRFQAHWLLAAAAVGLGIIFLSILIYLPTSRRNEVWRIYYYSSLGGAITIGSLVWFMAVVMARKYARFVFSGLMSLLILVAMIRLLDQHRAYSQAGQSEQVILTQIMQQAPELKRPTQIVVVKPPSENALNFHNLERENIFQNALSFLYENYDNVLRPVYCYIGCRFEESTVEIRGQDVAYNDILLFEASARTGITLLEEIPLWLYANGESTNYDPDALINRNGALPKRVKLTFGPDLLTYSYPLVAPDTFAAFFMNHYQTGQPVILEAISANCAIETDCQVFDWLKIVEPERFIITPESEADTDIRLALDAFVDEAEIIWQVQASYARAAPHDVQSLLNEKGYVPDKLAHWNNDRLFPTVTSYRRKPDDLENLYSFGDSFSLQKWSLQGPVQVSACQPVTLATWWAALNKPDDKYSMTFVLADQNGIGITNVDGPPAGRLTDKWEAGAFYYDERSLTIPCDIVPGEYPLLMGLYEPETLSQLPVTTSTGDPIPHLLYLTTLFVGE